VVRTSLTLAAVLQVGFGAVLGSGARHEPGCGGADSPSGGVNAPCTRTKDCQGSLTCDQGVCVDPDAIPVVVDAGADAPAAPRDGG